MNAGPDALSNEGAELPRITPREFTDYLKGEIARYAELGRKLNLRLE